jgi:hypothetical protein
MMVCGWLLNYMQGQLNYDEVAAYRTVFWAYAAVGLIKFSLAMALSKACEAERKQAPPAADPETAPLLGDGAEDEEKLARKVGSLWSISAFYSHWMLLLPVLRLCKYSLLRLLICH